MWLLTGKIHLIQVISSRCDWGSEKTSMMLAIEAWSLTPLFSFLHIQLQFTRCYDSRNPERQLYAPKIETRTWSPKSQTLLLFGFAEKVCFKDDQTKSNIRIHIYPFESHKKEKKTKYLFVSQTCWGFTKIRLFTNQRILMCRLRNSVQWKIFMILFPYPGLPQSFGFHLISSHLSVVDKVSCFQARSSSHIRQFCGLMFLSDRFGSLWIFLVCPITAFSDQDFLQTASIYLKKMCNFWVVDPKIPRQAEQRNQPIPWWPTRWVYGEIQGQEQLWEQSKKKMTDETCHYLARKTGSKMSLCSTPPSARQV